MSHTGNRLVEKAEAVENLLDLPNNGNIEVFYDVCDYIIDNNLLEESDQIIATLYVAYSVTKRLEKLNKRILNEPTN